MTNSGSVADSIEKVSTNVTRVVTAMHEASSAIAGTTTEVSEVTIAAHGSVRLTPGHGVLMLRNPVRSLKTGDKVSLTMTFSHAGTVIISLPVVPVTGPTRSGSDGMTGMPGMR